jgi:antitoxin component of RelBE/YafQ-DinJ toxin-antitoxin module
MTTKVTLDIDEEIAEKAKKYAEERGLTLSELVENFLVELLESKSKLDKKSI